MASRGKNYTEDELKQLSVSVLHVSQDPIIGTGQRAEKFWDRVHEHYERHKPRGAEVRGRKSLEGKWADVRHDVGKFVGCYQQVEARQVSGTNAEDSMKLAKELYKVNHPKNKNFQFEACFWILKDCPRFWTSSDEMVKGKAKKRGAVVKDSAAEILDNSTPTVEGLSSSDDERVVQHLDSGFESGQASTGQKRPTGSRKAKEELKRARHHDDALKMSAIAQKTMAMANMQRVQILANNSSLVLLSLPTETMDPSMAAFMKEWKLEEAMALRERMRKPLYQDLEVPTTRVVTSNVFPGIQEPDFSAAPVQPTAAPDQPTTHVTTTTPEDSDGDEDLAMLHEEQERISREQYEFELDQHDA